MDIRLTLLFFETIGTTELLLILVVALIVFGPRKLPQLSRSIGKSLGDFKRASEEFKRTWEREVAIEDADRGIENGATVLPPAGAIAGQTVQRGAHFAQPAGVEDTAEPGAAEQTTSPSLDSISAEAEMDIVPDTPDTSRKRDWL